MSDADTFHRIVASRFSCRAYLPEPVPRESIQKIVQTARHAPSWCNAQPWKVSITGKPETDRFRNALFAHASSGASASPDLDWPEGYPGIYGERRRTCGFQLYEAVGIEKGDRAASGKQMMENFRLFGAPHVLILHAPKALGSYGAMDCGGFVTAFCIAAQANGVASIPQAAVAAHADFVRDWFGLDTDRLILCAISFGFADHAHPVNSFRTDRATLDELVDWKGGD